MDNDTYTDTEKPLPLYRNPRYQLMLLIFCAGIVISHLLRPFDEGVRYWLAEWFNRLSA